MIILISQDGLKAIDPKKIEFLVIESEKNSRGKYSLLAKTPKNDGFYEFLILFEHKDIEVVKKVMEFLFAFQMAITDDFILHIDLETLYKCGMKEIIPELFTSEQMKPASSVASKVTVPIELDTTPLDEAQKKADKLKATLSEVLEIVRQTNSLSEH